MGEGVQNAGYGGVGRKDAHQHNRDGSKGHDESDD
jgi:hypothetical protein